MINYRGQKILVIDSGLWFDLLSMVHSESYKSVV